MNVKPKAGLLPLYLKLYDDRIPTMRDELAPFVNKVAEALNRTGIELVSAPICRLKSEVAAAVKQFEDAGADCIVTLHLAYSPSLEAVDALIATPLPIVMCDTTMDTAFDSTVDPYRLLFNHGIHGVQDLASTLNRRRRPYVVVAGHMDSSDVIDRTADAVRAARCVALLRHTKALRIGPVFEGMGDFAVGEALMESRLGIRTDTIQPSDLTPELNAITNEEIEAEIRKDLDAYTIEADPSAHRRAVRVGLGVRGRLARGGYDAFSMHFGHFSADHPDTDTVPFLEASKAMARGVGYAGEGDILCAALIGALSRSFGNTTFTEMFCPDWAGESVFLSHMGEFNPVTAAARPVLCDKPMPFCDSRDTVVLAAGTRPGKACLVNLAPQPADTFALIVAPVEVLPEQESPAMRGTIRGWIRPAIPVARFLERYSELGGTHHIALVLGDHVSGLCRVAKFLGINGHQIG
ncbi:MAG: hypothetical protein R3C45_09040 [Phycisphaerales bacterium]